jgi:hypothetical protein
MPSDSDSSAADRQDCTEVSGNRRSQLGRHAECPDSSAADRRDVPRRADN